MLRMTEEEYQAFLARTGKSKPQAEIAGKQRKYRNHFVYVYQDGFVCQEKVSGHGEIQERYDSIKEYRRWRELQMLERAGRITNLKRQVKILIQPSFTNSDGKRMRAIFYTADATYSLSGLEIVEDVKAVDKRTGKPITTETFRIKWKLLQKRYPEKVFQIF